VIFTSATGEDVSRVGELKDTLDGCMFVVSRVCLAGAIVRQCAAFMGLPDN